MNLKYRASPCCSYLDYTTRLNLNCFNGTETKKMRVELKEFEKNQHSSSHFLDDNITGCNIFENEATV